MLKEPKIKFMFWAVTYANINNIEPINKDSLSSYREAILKRKRIWLDVFIYKARLEAYSPDTISKYLNISKEEFYYRLNHYKIMNQNEWLIDKKIFKSNKKQLGIGRRKKSKDVYGTG